MQTYYCISHSEICIEIPRKMLASFKASCRPGHTFWKLVPCSVWNRSVLEMLWWQDRSLSRRVAWPQQLHPSCLPWCTSSLGDILLPGKSHGRRSLIGYSPWGCEELDTTERLHFTSLLGVDREEALSKLGENTHLGFTLHPAVPLSPCDLGRRNSSQQGLSGRPALLLGSRFSGWWLRALMKAGISFLQKHQST